MGAIIVVTSSPYATTAELDGNFALPDVPHGSYTLRIWNVDEALRSEQLIEVVGAQTVWPQD